MALDPSNSSSLEQLALKGLMEEELHHHHQWLLLEIINIQSVRKTEM